MLFLGLLSGMAAGITLGNGGAPHGGTPECPYPLIGVERIIDATSGVLAMAASASGSTATSHRLVVSRTDGKVGAPHRVGSAIPISLDGR